MSKQNLKKGFSLAELAIVLVIIGLLVTGVTAGSKLIKGAELNRLITEIREINTAYVTFYQTYDQIPGDFDIPESYWTTEVADNGGDNDGNIEFAAGVLGTLATGTEVSNVFRHLAISDILPGSYNEQIDQGEYAYVSSSGARGVILNTYPTGADATGFIADLANKNVLFFANAVQTTTTAAIEPGVQDAFLVPKDAHRIDTKLDDGLPTSGTISYRDETTPAGNTTPATCITGSAYLLTSTTKGCNLVYELDSL